MKFIETVFSKLQRHPKRIVFPEGTEPRVLHAAAEMVKLKIAAPILLGNVAEMERIAQAEGIDLARIGLIDPASASDLPMFCQWLTRLQRYRNLGPGEAEGFLKNPNYFAAMMIQHGQADGLVGGVSGFAGSLLRPLFQLVKPLPGVSFISSCMVMALKDPQFGENGVLFFADCAVIPEPTVPQLAQIGVQAGTLCAQLTGVRPRVAFLSFSTKGSSKHASAEKMSAATAQARRAAESAEMDMEIDGELQADTALLRRPAASRLPSPATS